jgi:hypothetical protein
VKIPASLLAAADLICRLAALLQDEIYVRHKLARFPTYLLAFEDPLVHFIIGSGGMLVVLA